MLVTARSGDSVSDQCVEDSSTAADDDVGGCELWNTSAFGFKLVVICRTPVQHYISIQTTQPSKSKPCSRCGQPPWSAANFSHKPTQEFVKPCQLEPHRYQATVSICSEMRNVAISWQWYLLVYVSLVGTNRPTYATFRSLRMPATAITRSAKSA